MRKSKLRRKRGPATRGTYLGFHWERKMDGPLAYFSISDHLGRHLGGSSDYRRFIKRWQEQNGVPVEVARKRRERGTARVLADFMYGV